MHWFVNDASLCGQYPDAAAFAKDLAAIMSARAQLPLLAQSLLCSRDLHTRPVTPSLDFRGAVYSVPKHIPLRSVLEWLTKQGPYWDDVRTPVPDDYFEHNAQDITHSGIGEAARTLLAGRDAESFSFANGGFNYSPIHVQHGLAESPLGVVSISNTWDVNALCRRVQSMLPAPVNWGQALAQIQRRFDGLIISSNAMEALAREPFSRYVVERLLELLAVLQEFVVCRDADGSYSARNNELIETYFSGSKAWFTDESNTNKNIFRNEMTFCDPGNNRGYVFCPWHGKIKSPQYRIHFEWPIPQGAKLRVFYIGPKITKS
jgi:hypothetical protein